MLRTRSLATSLLLLLVVPSVLAVDIANGDGLGDLEPAPADVDPRAIARLAEDSLRSDRTYMEAEMTIRSPRLTQPRVVAFRSWDDRVQKRSFIRILKPPKDAGAAFLKLHPNLWSYVPRVERTLRIPPSMMLQPWMGSDLTNDDLVNESSDTDDYDHRMLGIDPNAGRLAADAEAGGAEAILRAYVVEYTPHEEAPVVWGKIVAWIEMEHGTPPTPGVLRRRRREDADDGVQRHPRTAGAAGSPPLACDAAQQRGARNRDRHSRVSLRRNL